MGLASGKLTISHTEDKNKTETFRYQVAEVDPAASHPVNAAQPVTNKNHVAVEPAAHGDQAVVVAATETPAEVTDNGPNGTVNTTDAHSTDVGTKEDKPAKKTKNPLVWIQRRLSKRHSTSKKPATTTDKATEEDAAAASAETEQGEQAKNDDNAGSVPKVVAVAPVVDGQIVEAASSLVDQVLNTALVQQLSDTNVESAVSEVIPPATPEPIESHEPSTPTAHIEESEQAATPSVDHQCPTEQTTECVPVEHCQMHAPVMEEASSVVQEMVNGDAVQAEAESDHPEPEQPKPEYEEEKTTEPAETEAVVDSNNTNAECAEYDGHEEQQHSHQEESMTEEQTALETATESENQTENLQEPAMHSDDALAAKLSSLELTNGHSENHVTNGEASAEVVLNGN